MRVTTESPLVTRTSVAGAEYVARKGIFDMPEAHARAYLKATDQAALSLAGVRRTRDGYWCDPCKFATYFKSCSRCGGNCRREGTPDGSTEEDRQPGG
jgi:hypothetical protein